MAQTNQLKDRLTSDLSKNSYSPEIQEIVKAMDDMVKEQYKILKVTMVKTTGE